MADFDQENEVHVEYYYDLVLRCREPEEIISALRGGRMMSFWDKAPPGCKHLSDDEIQSLFDSRVVDWHDFHSRYLESISSRRAKLTSKKAAVERSHDQVDDLFSLINELKCAHPENIENASKHKKIEWQSKINVLALHYQQMVNLDLHHGGVADLPTKVRDILRRPWKPKDDEHHQTIYYVAGAVMKMIDNLEQNSKNVYTQALKDIKNNSSTTKLDARKESLPSAKVEEKEVYGLCYPNKMFYDFVTKVESVFDTLLSEGNVAYYGMDIISDITHALSKEDLGIEQFYSRPYDESLKAEILRRIIRSYGRLRGKDFVRKCNAKVGVKYHETTRSALGTAAAIASKNAKKGAAEEGGANSKDSKEVISTRYQFLIKQRK